MNTPRFTFRKEERLTGTKVIDELFQKGSSFYLHPFKIISLERNISLSPDRPVALPKGKAFPVQVLISVPTKNFKRAVDRNKIKRLIREAYRLNKHLLYHSLPREEQKNKQLVVALLYTSKTIESFNFIQEKLIAILDKLVKQNSTGEKPNA